MPGVYSHLVVIGVGYPASLFFAKPVIAKNILYSGWLEEKTALKDQMTRMRHNRHKEINSIVLKII